MKRMDSDRRTTFRGEAFHLRPWTDEHFSGAIGVTSVRPRAWRHANELNSGEISDSFNNIIDEATNLINRNTLQVNHGASSDDSVVPTEKPIVRFPSSFSAETFFGTNSNLNEHSYIVDRLTDRILASVFLQHSASPSHNRIEKPDLSTEISNATDHEKIFDILNRAGCRKIATRLRNLYATAQDDDPDMDILSLRRFSVFFTRDDISLPDPKIVVVSRDGFLKAEWYSSNAAALLNFLPNGNIVFAATSDIDGHDEPRDIHGTCEKELALQFVWPFIH